MTPGITASQMPAWPPAAELDGRAMPRADAAVARSTESPSVKHAAADKNLNVYVPHHVYYPLPPMDQVPPLEKAKSFHLPNVRDADKVDMRGYRCYKRHQEALRVADEACTCVFADDQASDKSQE